MTKKPTTDSEQTASIRHWEDALIELLRATYPEITGVDFLKPKDATNAWEYKFITLHAQVGPASKIIHESLEIKINGYTKSAIIEAIGKALVSGKWKEDKAHAQTFGHTLY